MVASFFQNGADCNKDSTFDSYVCFLIMQNQPPYQKAQRLCLLGFANFSASAFAAASISHKIPPGVFLVFFNCERKTLISAKKCVSLNLAVMGSFEPINSTLCTHPSSSMLSSTTTDCSFVRLKRFNLSLGEFFKIFSMIF